MLPMNVLVVDDHNLFRQGLVSLMTTRPDLVRVVAEAENGADAIKLAQLHQPDLILMDILMPRMDGLSAAVAIRRVAPDACIIMLTASDSDEHFSEAIKSGVAGYLHKNLDADELFELIEGVERGEAALTRAMAARMLKGVAKQAVDPNQGEEALTEREIEVLRLLAQGASNQEIGDQLHISINTVKSHISHILDKLQVENRTQAATYAVQRRIVTDL
jgi:two-component system NarL family response regulator